MGERCRTVASVLLVVVFAQTAIAVAPTAAAAVDPRALERLAADSGGRASVTPSGATGVARFIRIAPGALPLPGGSPAERARAFLERHAGLFGLERSSEQLADAGERHDRFGFTHVTYRQGHRGLPVFAGIVLLHFDPEGELTAVNGTVVPGIALDTRPRRSPHEAEAIALADVAGSGGARASELPVARAERLVVFRAGLVRGVPGRVHLAYEVEVTNGRDVRELVIVDAHTGKVIDRIARIHDALSRKIHEPDFNDAVIWNEGDSLPYQSGSPSHDAQVNELIERAADVRKLYSNLSGGSFLSWDGLDGVMHSVFNAVFVNCPNATWNGTSTNFCDGTASDDVIAHEWTHAYTESTHGLIYQWQPGALNEAYSDIFGELVDQLDGAGTDTPGPLRTVGDCSSFGGASPPSLVVDAPPSIAGSYGAGGANFNPDPPITVTGQLLLANDGNDEGGSASVTDACQPLVGFVPGTLALIDRGTCSFASKVKRAQDAGAIGAIIVNNQDSTLNMSGSDPTITIPAVMVSSSTGTTIENELGAGVDVTIHLPVPGADSVRWLLGEDAFGQGGAIRDLWNPTCFGDPPKVSGPSYSCGFGDNGGVHTNSGVPNHAFALLVDGGTFNGQTVAAIGPTRAASLYWRAMSEYQVPATDFADHADALAQSCADLLGVELPDPWSGAASGQSLDPADCQAVSAAMLAVEMAAPPPCAFEPVLEPNPPPVECGAIAYSAGFEESEPEGWVLTNSGVFPEYVPRNWEVTFGLPAGRPGTAFFAIDSPQIGNCIEGEDDQSGRMSLTSPAIPLGGNAILVFDHYVGTEPRYDGGNLAVIVGFAPLVPIGPEAFLFNPYNDTLVTAGEGNTNPKAGESAFTGADGGEVVGSWGQSQVSLDAYAGPGDTIRVRFDFGTDGCNGIDGWYVDDVILCTDQDGAGRVPDGVLGGTPLTIAKGPAGAITLSWGTSCDAGDPDYAVYEGVIGSFASHVPRACSTGGSMSASFTPSLASSYYLVVPHTAAVEGAYGNNSRGKPRPQGPGACLPQLLSPCAAELTP